MIILGINDAHNASCALAVDGEIIAAAQEERFTRVKNQFGIPYNAIQFCLDFAKIKPQDVDLVVFSGGIPQFITSTVQVNPEFKNTLTHNILRIGKYSQLHF